MASHNLLRLGNYKVKRKYLYLISTIFIELICFMLIILLNEMSLYITLGALLIALFIGIAFIAKKNHTYAKDLRWGILFGSIFAISICFCTLLYMGLTFDLPNQD
jgi:hypothetical protein